MAPPLFNPALEGLTGRFFSTAPRTITGTAEASVIPPGIGSMAIPAGWFKPGYNARLVVRGTVTTPLVAGTANIRVKVGGATLVSAATTGLLGSLTNQSFKVICNIQCYTEGVNGTFGVAGEVAYPTGLLGINPGNQTINSTTSTFNTTVEQMVDVTAQWGLTGHSISTTVATLELMKM